MPEKTKKTPTSRKPGSRATSRPMETPKGSRESVPPSGATVAVPLAGFPPLIREVGTALVRLTGDRQWAALTQLATDARTDLEDRVETALLEGGYNSRVPSVLTAIAVRHVVSSLTAEAVLVLVQSHPELVLETERLVTASRPAEV